MSTAYHIAINTLYDMLLPERFSDRLLVWGLAFFNWGPIRGNWNG
jgi:hypothetical protein